GDGDDAGDGDGDFTGGDGDGDEGSGDGDQGTGDGDGDTQDPSPADPATCADTSDWDPDWIAKEEAILDLVNEARAEGAVCGGQVFAPTQALVMDPALQCAARLHSKDMNDREFFSHDNPSGEDPWERIEDAGFAGNPTGENIAGGNATAEETMEQWMGSDGHCSNIMAPGSAFIGVGYYPGGEWNHLWTQTFGK